MPNGETLSSRRFLERVFEAAGNKPRYRIASRRLLSVLGLVSPMMRELKEMVYEFEEPFVVDHSKFEREFGAAPTAVGDAIAETVEWFRRHPA